ncbi:hypothetical protein B0I35DRAFT_380237 [Stachybotrys elegans]|uniref:Bilirubin oxidase n=1 Tax=Stachybotrys elegans TaxID=80388 RepID=A0A8K0SG62_9HYPO|nr:hypothetical protein B0I35DRAFT_380237 [Stachybotrys elegans]
MVRQLLQLAAVGLSVIGTCDARSVQKRQNAQLSPPLELFSVPLPIPPVKEPKYIVPNPETGDDIQYYEMEIQPFSEQIYPDLGLTHMVGYDGMSPGPTIIVPRGTETVVRFVNSVGNTSPNSVHLHGSFSRAPFDGWAEDTTQPGEYKDYYYPNRQAARMLWYHDHAMSITAENAYMGQAGVYLIHDPAEDALNLPSGYGEFDIPMVLTAKRYNDDGTLFSTNGELSSLFGDVIQVNGQPWPFMNVQPRKYRFRFLDAAVSRSFALHFALTDDTATDIPFQVIASDAGLLEEPVDTEVLHISMAERYEIVFDFSNFAGQSIDLLNLPSVDGLGTDTNYVNTDKVMRFIVADETEAPDTSVVPATLRDVPFPEPGSGDFDHDFVFTRTNGQWTINGIVFTDVENRLLANVPRGSVQRWRLRNPGGGWTHPIHVHLVDMRVISRSSARGVEPYEAAGLKDVVWLARQETVIVEAHFAPFPGVYMMHCHNLIHEDHDMMAAFNVSVLADYGYNYTDFIDPMNPLWRPRPFELGELEEELGEFSLTAVTKRIGEMVSYHPYAAADDEGSA